MTSSAILKFIHEEKKFLHHICVFVHNFSFDKFIFSSDVFDYLVLNTHGSELLELINETLIIVSIVFDFVLVTDPCYYVYVGRGDENLCGGENSYIRELTLLMNSCYRIVSPKQYSWSTIPCPGLRSDKNSCFKFAGYLASR